MNINIGGFLIFLVLFAFSMGILLTIKFTPNDYLPFAEARSSANSPDLEKNADLTRGNKYSQLQLELKQTKDSLAQAKIQLYNCKKEKNDIAILKAKILSYIEREKQLEQTINSLDSLLALNEKRRQLDTATIDSLRGTIVKYRSEKENIETKYKKMQVGVSLYLKSTLPALIVLVLGIAYLFYRKKNKAVFLHYQKRY